MKKVTIPLGGVEYPLCFSLRVVQACGERFNGLENMDQALSGAGDPVHTIGDCVWLLSRMLDAGYRYEKGNGTEAKMPPTEEALWDNFGLDDLADLQLHLMTAMTAGKERTVEVEPPKNGMATPETPD